MITSCTNEKIKDLTKLALRKYRDESGFFVVEGFHLVEAAIQAGSCIAVYTTDPDYSGFSVVNLVSEPVMKKISDVDSPQGILAICKRPQIAALGDKILLLDGIADPGNMGTLLRTALAFGFRTVVVENCVDVTNPKVLRSTQGAFFHVNLLASSIVEFMENHDEYTYFGTDLHQGIPLGTLESVPCKTGLVLGNEASGVRPEILARTKTNLYIEIAGIESLNVAVAGSILMHRLQ